MLNLSSASRFFYPNFLPTANSESTSLAWSNQYDLSSCIPYESIKENWGGIRPLAMGDALGGNWAATNLSLYSGSSVGYLAAVIDTTDVEGILQIDMNKTDFSPFMTEYPAYLYYNPHGTAKTVIITLPAGTYDIYDAIQETKVKTSVSGSATITVSPDNIMLLTLYPAGGIWKINGRILSVENGGVLDYHYGYNYQNSLRVVSLTAENNTVQIGDSVLLTCRTENGDNVNYRWYANDALVGNSTNNTFYYKPQTEGDHVLHCIATAAADTASSERITVLAATFIAPEIESLILQQGAGHGLYQISSTVSVSAAVRGSNYSINWTVSGGTLSFPNDSLSPLWTLPNQNGLHTVTLTVENILGSETATQTVLVKNITAENYYTPIIYYPFINGSTKNVAGNDFNAINTGASVCPGISGTANNALQFGNSSQYLYIENIDAVLHFYDLNGKLFYKLGSSDRITLVGVHVVPAERVGAVYEVHAGDRHAENVAAVVSAKRYAVAAAQLVEELSVEVVEVEHGVAHALLGRQRQKEVGVGAPSGRHERKPVADDGAVHLEPAGDKPHAAAHVELAEVAGFAAHLQQRRQPAAVGGRDVALVELHVVHHVVVEHRKEAHEVRGVVHRSVVEQDEVLVGAAAAHAERRRPLGGGLHAGQQHDGLYHVHLAHQRRNSLDGFYLQLLHAHFGSGNVGAARSVDLHRLQLGLLLPERKIPRLRTFDLQRLLARAVAHVADGDGVGARRKRNAVKSLSVGYDVALGFADMDNGSRQRFVRLRILHVPAQGWLLRLRRQQK